MNALKAAEKASAIPKYWMLLKRHPGAPIASAITVMGFAAGAKGDEWIVGGLVGAAIMSIFWIPVLWTAWEDFTKERRKKP
jgi:hypothetical protein